MPKRIYVRPIRPEESKLFFDWAKENPAGEFDPEVPLFPSSTTWCAFDEDGPLVFQTLQQPVVLESLAIRPGADDRQISSAMKELTQNAVTHAFNRGAGEIYYLGTDEDTDAFACNHIFEPLPYRVFRVKLKNLEG
jgi:hypothetical protein